MNSVRATDDSDSPDSNWHRRIGSNQTKLAFLPFHQQESSRFWLRSSVGDKSHPTSAINIKGQPFLLIQR